MNMKYGKISNKQLCFLVRRIRKTIFLLLLAVDEATKKQNEHIDIDKTFEGVLLELGGITSLLPDRSEFIETINFLERAKIEFFSPDFNFNIYRKLILDAGAKMIALEKSLKTE